MRVRPLAWVHSRHGEGRKLGATIRQVLENRVGQVADAPEVQHALQARSAIASRSYHRFFELYASAPNLGRALLDVHVPSMRWHALNALARAFRPGVPLRALAEAAGFAARPSAAAAAAERRERERERSRGGGGGGPLPGRGSVVFDGDYAAVEDEGAGLAAAEEWALSCGAVIVDGPGGERLLDGKASCGRGVLHAPPEKGKVAHGDVNLDIHDFLAKIAA
ncbi:hypothetical protein MNEG_12976 [Monoraphidium neglectum]|uniref:SAC3/GANP/THP3 conserved domain-containing protein n=1 Tax=Monoraphidium neglectum TaxID=145388 RepID=A0A0D2LTJ9_9CHLO|nr:hypothetical protein MNEG_12976 [Monoraphidium neglectum]KIY94984.1 hypothetical protein MNEG_12976 [Monoraphidium neglectum]|eukprot:XP_013894004.1 hypothetical protein MNEG_12976 [Monoraphidium neglectum]